MFLRKIYPVPVDPKFISKARQHPQLDEGNRGRRVGESDLFVVTRCEDEGCLEFESSGN
jgi:hypothetical protein